MASARRFCSDPETSMRSMIGEWTNPKKTEIDTSVDDIKPSLEQIKRINSIPKTGKRYKTSHRIRGTKISVKHNIQETLDRVRKAHEALDNPFYTIHESIDPEEHSLYKMTWADFLAIQQDSYKSIEVELQEPSLSHVIENLINN